MRIETKIQKIEDVVINLNITATVGEWQIINNAIYETVKNAFYGPNLDLYKRISESINTIKNSIEQQDFDV